MEKIDLNKFDNNINYDELIESSLKELKSDEDVYNIIKEQNMTIKEVKANIAHLIDFKNDYNYCKNCPGLEKCQKDLPHFRKTIRFDKNIQYLYCNTIGCEPYLNKLKIDSLYLEFDAPEEWKGKKIKDLDLSSVRRPLIKSFVDIVNEDKSTWLYVTGNHKCGKSIMLAALATEYALKKNCQVAFVNTANIVKELNSSIFKNKESFEMTMESLSIAPLLVFDGFGNEVITEFNRDNIVFPLLSNRSSAGLPTFFASDLSLNEIQSLYSVGKNNGAIRAKQMVSLIKDNSDIYDITGIVYHGL